MTRDDFSVSSNNVVVGAPLQGVDKISTNGAIPSLQDILTIIVTTSPIKSNPSTEVLERTFQSFFHAGTEFALQCRKLIICDDYRIKDDHHQEETTVSRKHNSDKHAMRSGICTFIQSQNYELYKDAVRKMCKNAQHDSAFKNTEVKELKTRQGYGFALRHALRHFVRTPYVCVIQHDRTFMRPTPILETVHAMWKHPETIKYVTMSMRSNLMYLDIFRGKYGKDRKDLIEEMNHMVLKPSELNLDSAVYGPDGYSAQNMAIDGSEKLKKSIEDMAKTYRGSAQYIQQQKWIKLNPNETGKHQLTLTPTLFWYDNIHICQTCHYRDFIFDPNLKMVAKGGFVEDKLSPVIVKTVKRLGLSEGHGLFGCYLLDDHSGKYFTGHIDGGGYIIKTHRERLRNEKA